MFNRNKIAFLLFLGACFIVWIPMCRGFEFPSEKLELSVIDYKNEFYFGEPIVVQLLLTNRTSETLLLHSTFYEQFCDDSTNLKILTPCNKGFIWQPYLEAMTGGRIKKGQIVIPAGKSLYTQRSLWIGGLEPPEDQPGIDESTYDPNCGIFLYTEGRYTIMAEFKGLKSTNSWTFELSRPEADECDAFYLFTSMDCDELDSVDMMYVVENDEEFWAKRSLVWQNANLTGVLLNDLKILIDRYPDSRFRPWALYAVGSNYGSIPGDEHRLALEQILNEYPQFPMIRDVCRRLKTAYRLKDPDIRSEMYQRIHDFIESKNDAMNIIQP